MRTPPVLLAMTSVGRAFSPRLTLTRSTPPDVFEGEKVVVRVESPLGIETRVAAGSLDMGGFLVGRVGRVDGRCRLGGCDGSDRERDGVESFGQGVDAECWRLGCLLHLDDDPAKEQMGSLDDLMSNVRADAR